ncbi:MAG: biotin/lipoyl-binding protein [Lamprobacter sp.]|uniref:efflux RND transporter periplasmic adaptor subunit n=1 Tax=Lamprobacter sp. TaxID=3100796 RepID=UPI002B258C1F|nr:biotin/lipoyl-binding protein [Lamprobacter sp.]MEA3642303.1 biotin/lipoyl-binding protein [Lamprobacter sp.]
MKFILPVLILAVGFGLFRLLLASKPEKATPSVQERVWRVEVEPVELIRAAPQLELYGRVETPDLLRATASASAWVTEVLVRDGDRVAEGEVLLRLDERDFRPRIAQVEAEIADLQAQIASEKNRVETDRLGLEQEQRLLQLAQDAVQRQQRLKTQQVGAEQALDDAKRIEAQQQLTVSSRQMSIADHPSRLRGLEARLASAKARLAELRLEFERATLRAPYAGIITEVAVTEGDQVTRGEVLVRLYALDSLEVRARVPAPYQDELIAMAAQDLPLSASAIVGGESLTLHFDRLAGEADPSGVDALFKLDGDPSRVRLGQLLTVSLERPTRNAVVEVPFRAVYGGGRLYVVKEGRMQGLDVESLGTRMGDDGEERLLVRSDQLEAGDALVTTHMPNAIEGLRVEIVDAEAADDRMLAKPDVAGTGTGTNTGAGAGAGTGTSAGTTERRP